LYFHAVYETTFYILKTKLVLFSTLETYIFEQIFTNTEFEHKHWSKHYNMYIMLQCKYSYYFYIVLSFLSYYKAPNTLVLPDI